MGMIPDPVWTWGADVIAVVSENYRQDTVIRVASLDLSAGGSVTHWACAMCIFTKVPTCHFIQF